MKIDLAACWNKKNIITYLLLPFSFIYLLIILCRKKCYEYGVFKVNHFDIPIVVVGNITVGGTGKSPLIAALANRLQQHGLVVGLVSRGYKGKSDVWPRSVTLTSNPSDVGDEPVMLVRQTNCPMYVGPNRVVAVNALLKEHKCDIVLSDDGLQHYALGRQVEISVIDGVKRYGNGYCLPAGPLREPKSRLSNVNLKVCQGDALAGEMSMKLELADIVSLIDAAAVSIDSFYGKPIHAVAGIGNPERFFSMLERHGLKIIRHAFTDHHVFNKEDIDFNNEVVLMTAKDAVKCCSIAGPLCYSVNVNAVCDNNFWLAIESMLISK
jgi:tetraacyldisaccharide 4'-kinase